MEELGELCIKRVVFYAWHLQMFHFGTSNIFEPILVATIQHVKVNEIMLAIVESGVSNNLKTYPQVKKLQVNTKAFSHKRIKPRPSYSMRFSTESMHMT